MHTASRVYLLIMLTDIFWCWLTSLAARIGSAMIFGIHRDFIYRACFGGLFEYFLPRSATNTHFYFSIDIRLLYMRIEITWPPPPVTLYLLHEFEAFQAWLHDCLICAFLITLISIAIDDFTPSPIAYISRSSFLSASLSQRHATSFKDFAMRFFACDYYTYFDDILLIAFRFSLSLSLSFHAFAFTYWRRFARELMLSPKHSSA